jgi:enoyl-CoA hydratase/carnithine racemase
MADAADAPLLIDRPAPGVTRLRLNRPQARNALNTALREALAQAFAELDRDEATRCIVLTGGEQVFAAGADLKEFAALGPAAVWRLDAPRHWKAIADCGKPIVAAVAGAALGGGCELAQHADLIVAARSARFGQPEVTVGIMPGGGATQRLVKALGKYRALRLLLTGEAIGADEALAAGLVSEVVDDERLMPRALEIAALIASRPPVALRLLKQAALAADDMPLAAGLMLERRAFELLFDTADQKEGLQAFAERRPANFVGR